MPMMIALKAATPQLPRTTAVADHVVAVDETDSTNALAVQMIGDGSLTLPDHQDGELAVAVVAADRQTAGRGRNGHKWVSQPGRCSTMSYAVRIPRAIATDESVNGWLQMIAGLVTLDALNGMIEEYGAAPNQPDCSLELKWPNDVFCHGLKLGGLLSELVIPPSSGTGTDADADDDVVIVFGVGLNLALGACRLPTPQSTSLQLHVSGLPSFGEMRDAVAERQVEGFRERLVKIHRRPEGPGRVVARGGEGGVLGARPSGRGALHGRHHADRRSHRPQRRRLTDPENTRRHGPYGPHRRCGSAVIAGQ